jgi:hypothetical protein
VTDQPWSDTLSTAVAAVLLQPGGDALVVDSLARIPQTRRVELKTGWFSRVSALELGDRRFRPSGDGRLHVQHVVNDVAVSSAVVAPVEAGRLVASAARTHAAHFGPTVEGEIAVVAEGLAALAR